MSDETTSKKSAKKELSFEDRVKAEVAKEQESQKLDIEVRREREIRRTETNKIKVQKAFNAGLTSPTAIGKEIGMSANGVKAFATELGLTLIPTAAEKQREYDDHMRKLSEEVEKARFGIINK